MVHLLQFQFQFVIGNSELGPTGQFSIVITMDDVQLPECKKRKRTGESADEPDEHEPTDEPPGTPETKVMIAVGVPTGQKSIWHFDADVRNASVEGTFIERDDRIERALNENIKLVFGEVAGKHSFVKMKFNRIQIVKKSSDPAILSAYAKLRDLGCIDEGFGNPLYYGVDKGGDELEWVMEEEPEPSTSEPSENLDQDCLWFFNEGSYYGKVEGLFIATKRAVYKEQERNKDVFFGEAKGKHSEVIVKFNKLHVSLVTDDPSLVETQRMVFDTIGQPWMGYNPIVRIQEYGSESEDDSDTTVAEGGSKNNGSDNNMTNSIDEVPGTLDMDAV